MVTAPTRWAVTTIAIWALAGCGALDRIDHAQDAGSAGGGGSAGNGGAGGGGGSNLDGGGGGDAGLDGGGDGGRVPACTELGTPCATNADCQLNEGCNLATSRCFDTRGGCPDLGVYVRGIVAPTPSDQPWQTPSVQKIGVCRFELLRSAADPSPELVFDHGPDTTSAHRRSVPVDMLGESDAGQTLVGRGASNFIQPGSYSHGRATLCTIETVVDATLHTAGGLVVAGKLTIKGALSDAVVGQDLWTKGQATYRFVSNLGGVDVTRPGTLPPLPLSGGGTITEGANPGRTWLDFQFQQPMVIATGTPGRMTMVFHAGNSFRWQDQASTGYATYVFDMHESGTSEPIQNFGATGYSFTVP